LKPLRGPELSQERLLYGLLRSLLSRT